MIFEGKCIRFMLHSNKKKLTRKPHGIIFNGTQLNVTGDYFFHSVFRSLTTHTHTHLQTHSTGVFRLHTTRRF